MSGHRNTGGVQGTVLFRGWCPDCGRAVAGGNTESGNARGSRIMLRPHKAGQGHWRDWCPGGHSIVEPDRDEMRRYARHRRRP